MPDPTVDAPALRRMAAGLVDLGILVAAGFALVTLAFDLFALFGPGNFAIGLLLVTAYAWLGSSSLTGGRTAGKWLLGLRVARAQEPVPVRALSRTILLVWPGFLLAAFDADALSHAATSPWRWSAVTLGASILAANAFLLGWTTAGRRLLHDRVGRSWVVVGTSPPQRPAGALVEWQSMLLWCIPPLVFLALCGLVPHAPAAHPLRHGLVVVQGPDTTPLVSEVHRLSYEEPEGIVDGTPRPVLVVEAEVLATPLDPLDFARSIALAVYTTAEPHGAYDAVQVHMTQTVDLGIARGSRSRTETVPAPHKRLAALAHLPADEAATRQHQMDGAFQNALRLAGAVARFETDHLHAPTPAEIAATPGLQPITGTDSRVWVAATGAINADFSGGPLARHSFALVPLGMPGHLRWTCARHDIPADYFDPRCR